MQKIALLTGAVVVALGMGAVSTSAFAACLSPQQQMVTPSLTTNLMVDQHGESAVGLPYNVDQYNALVAQGNTCSTTEQSLPVGQQTSQRSALQSQQQQ